jgi:anti-anti-sigma factor
MGFPPSPSWLETVEVGDVTLIRFRQARLGEESQVRQVGEILLALAADPNRKKFVINLQGVQVLSSAMVGKLIALNKTLRASGRPLVLCGVEPGPAKIFEIVGLKRVFEIREDQAAAILAIAE